MRASLRWLNSLLDAPVTLHEAAECLTLAGFPVEHWEEAAAGDTVLEVELTSNRGDCLSHLGLAREIAAATGRAAIDPAGSVQTRAAAATSGQPCASVAVEDTDGCPLYTAHVLRGVRVVPSPAWMQERLRAIGQIPRNALVDATNYVLFERGQPTHVFDLARLAGPRIVVRRARAGERLLPIGEGSSEVALRPGDLVIADAEVPVAVAGVKGGALTAVTDATTDVLVEAATFDPRAVRHASRGLGLASDSSFRFERGVHPGQVMPAATRLVQLLQEVAGGRLAGAPAIAGLPVPPLRTVCLRLSRCSALLGSAIAAGDAVRWLQPLGLAPAVEGDVVRCTIPPERLDLTREADLIEEVARLRGLHHVPTHERITIRTHPPEPVVQAARAAKDALAGMGYLETVTHTLVPEQAARAHAAAADLLRVEDERALAPILRPSLLPSLLEVLAGNADRAGERPALFEVARAFSLDGDGRRAHREPVMLALVHPAGTGDRDGSAACRMLRGAVERIVRLVSGSAAEFSACADAPGIAPAMRVRLGEREIGRFGLVSPGALRASGVDGPVAAAELAFLEDVKAFPPEVRVQPLPSFPATDRDLSLIVPDAVRWGALQDHVRSLGLAHLEGIEWVATFRGAQTGQGRKSVTMRLRFRAPDRTLKREEAEAETARARESLQEAFGAEVRA